MKKNAFKRIISGFLALVIFISASPADLSVFSVTDPSFGIYKSFGIYNNFSCLTEHSENTTLYSLKFYADDLEHPVMENVTNELGQTKYKLVYASNDEPVLDELGQIQYVFAGSMPDDAPEGQKYVAVQVQSVYAADSGYLAGLPVYEQMEITLPTYYEFTFGTEKTYLERNGHVLLHAQEKLDFTANADLMTFLNENKVRRIDIEYDPDNDALLYSSALDNSQATGNTETQQCYVRFSGGDFVATGHEVNTFTSTDYLDHEVSLKWNDDGEDRPDVNDMSFTLRRKAFSSGDTPPSCTNAEYDLASSYEAGGALDGYADFTVSASNIDVKKLNSNENSIHFKVPAHSCNGDTYDYIAYRGDEDDALPDTEDDRSPGDYRSERTGKNSFGYTSLKTFDCELDFLDSARSGDSLLDRLKAMSAVDLLAFVNEHFELKVGSGTITIPSGSVSIETDTSGVDHLVISGLDAIDGSGNALNYYLQQKTSDTIDFSGDPTDADTDYYTVTAKNDGVNSNEVTKIYDGGKAVFLLTGETTFEGNLNWVDNATKASRLEKQSGNDYVSSFVLWRYVNDLTVPADDRADMKAQVGNFNIYGGYEDEHGHAQNQTTFAYVDSSGNVIDLPKYDLQGREYIYYAKESETRLSGYEISSTISGPASVADSIGNGATLTYSLSGTVNYVVDAKWIAASLQGGTGEIKYELERFDGTSWVSVPYVTGNTSHSKSELTIDGFSAELMEKDEPFYTDSDTPPDKYDAYGNLQIYRIVQKSIKRTDSGDSSAPTVQDIALSVNTTTGQFNTVTINGRKQILFDSASADNVVIRDSGDNITDTYFKQTIGGRKYKVRAFADNNNVYFEYTLVDTISLKVDKDWSKLPKSKFSAAWDAHIGLQLKIFDYKTGNYINYNTSAGNPGDITYKDSNNVTQTFSSDGSITVESSDKVGNDRFSVLLENVPQYDDEGHLNRFKVVEPTSYPGSSQNSTKITSTEPNEVIVTNHFKGSGERLELFKVWMDDGEAEYKSNVGIEASGRVMRLPMETSDSSEAEINIDTISDAAAAALLAESYTPVSDEDGFTFPDVWTFNGYWDDFVTGNGKYGTKNNDGTGNNIYPMVISDYLTNPTAEQTTKFNEQNTKMGNAITGKMSRFTETLDENNIYHISVPVRTGYTAIQNNDASVPANHYYRLKDFREYLTSSNVEGSTQQFYPTYVENDLSSDVQQTAVSALGISGSPILSSRIDSTVSAAIAAGTAGYTDIAAMPGVDYSYTSGSVTVDPVNFEWLAGIYEAKYKNGTYTRYYAVQEVPEYTLDGSGNPTRLRSITFKNTRVGAISYKVNFNWRVGNALSENLIRTINMKIEADYGDGVYHEISFNGNNYVPINVTEDLSEYYILNLPKYASNGRIINYKLSQISVVDNNNVSHPVSGTGTRTWQTSDGDNCVVTMTEDPHVINTASNTDDLYPITITNTFKDDEHIRIYKQWIDDSNALNTRSDLYIRLYRKDHNNYVVKSPIDYYWNPEQTNHWTYEFPAKPKYDDLGYKYTYYVDEITTDLAKADYVTTYYGDYGLNTQAEHDHAYNGDTIENKLEGTVTINGTKMWQYVSETLRNENYPIADVFLYKETKIQTGGISYHSTMSNDTYDGDTSYVLIDTDSSKNTNIELINIRQIRSGEKTFSFTNGYSLPINKTTGTVSNGGAGNYDSYGDYIFTGSAASLPKYDEYGAKINYFMDERTINGYNSTVNDQNLTNEYTGGDKFKITFNKTWKNMNTATGKAYPTLEVTLHQAYLGHNSSGVSLIDYETFTPPTPFYPSVNGAENNYSYTFGVRENLRMYAPTGEKFYYYFTERLIDEQRSADKDFANTYIAVPENDSRISDTTNYTQVYPESGSVSVATNSSGDTGKYVLLKQNTVNKGLGFICEIGEISGSTVNGEYTEKSGSVTNSYEPDENNFKGKLVINKEWENYNKTTENKANDEYEHYENYRFTVSRYTRSLSPAKNIFQVVTGGSYPDSTTDPNMPELVLGSGLTHPDYIIYNPGFFRYKNGEKVTTYDVNNNDYDYYRCELTFTKAAYTTFEPITVTITVYPAGEGNNKRVEIEGLAIYGQDGVGYTYTIDEVAASAYKATPETQSKQMGEVNSTLSYDLKNELNTFTLRLNKVFGTKYKNAGNTDTYEKLQPADYRQFFNADFVNNLSFKIQRKDPGGTDWYDYDYKSWHSIDSTHEKGVISGSDLTLGENGYYYDFRYLPKYKPVDDRLTSSDNAYQYRIIERNDWTASGLLGGNQHVWKYYPTGIDDVSITNSTDANAQAVTPGADTTSANVYVRNVFEAKDIRLDKFWSDNENADGLRGDYLPVTVTETITGQPDVAINRTLLASDSWTMQLRLPRYYYNGLNPIDGLSFNIDEAALNTVYQHEDENNRGKTLSELGYSKKEAGYEQSDGSGGFIKKTDSSANSTSQDSFIGLYVDNEKAKVNSKYTFEKSWSDFNNKWSLRPGTIYVKLLRKPEGGSAYSVVTLQNDGTTTIDPIVNGTHCAVNTSNGVISIVRQSDSTNKDIDMTIDNLDYGVNTSGGDQSNGTWKQYLYTIVECDQYGNDIQAPFTYSESSSGTQEIAKNIDVDINISALEQENGHRARHIHIKVLDGSSNLILSDVYGKPIKVTSGSEVFYSGASTEFVKEGIILLSVPEDESVTNMHIKIWNLPVSASYTIKRCKRDGGYSSDEGNVTYENQSLSSVTKPSGTTFRFSKTFGENSESQTLRPDSVYFRLYRRFESDSADSSSPLTVDNSSNALQTTVSGQLCTSSDGLFTVPVNNSTLSGNTLSGTVSGLDYGAFDGGVYKKYTYYAVECASDGTALSTGNTYTWAFDNEGTDKDKPFTLTKDSTDVYSEAELTEGITNTLRKDNHNLTTTWEDGTDQSARTVYYVKLQRRAGERGAWEDVTLASDGGNVFLSDNTEITNITSNVVSLQPSELNVSFKDLPVYDGSGTKYQYRVTETKIGGKDIINNKRYLFHIANDTSYVLGWHIRGTNNYYVDHGYDEMGYSFDSKSSTITNTLVINPVSYVHVKASKVWDDENNLYGKRPAEITYKLTRTKTTVTVDPDTGNVTTIGPEPDTDYCLYTTVTEKDKWETTWYRCAAFSDEGVEYNYIVYEVESDVTFKGKTYKGLPAGYSRTSTVDGSDIAEGELVKTFEFTNEYEPQKKSLTAMKDWVDQSDLFSLRPANVTYTLYCSYEIWDYDRDGSGKVVTDSNGNPQGLSKRGDYGTNLGDFTGDVVYSPAVGTEGNEGYVAEKRSKVFDSILVKKSTATVDDVRKTLNKNDNHLQLTESPDTYDDDKWTETFSNLPSWVNTCGDGTYAGHASPVTYYIVESFTDTATTNNVKIAYECGTGNSLHSSGVTLISEDGTAPTDRTDIKAATASTYDDGVTITNTLRTHDVIVTNTWDDQDCTEDNSDDHLHSNIKVTLSSSDFTESSSSFSRDGVIDKLSDKVLVFRALPKYSTDTGEPVTYSIAEEFTTSSATTESASAAVSYQDVSGITAPFNEQTGAVDATEFTQNKDNSGKQKYGYEGSCEKSTVTEIAGKPFVERYDITNQLSVTTVNVTKNWADNFSSTENYYDLRPGTIDLQLYRTIMASPVRNESNTSSDNTEEATKWITVDINGTTAGTKKTENTDKDSASKAYSYENLLRYSENNSEYCFMVKEDPVPAYETTYPADITSTGASKSLSVTNTLSVRPIVVAKKWENGSFGNSLQYNVKVTLSSAGLNVGGTDATHTYSQYQIIPANASKSASFASLPIYDKNGNVITYSVREEYTADPSTATSDTAFDSTAADNATEFVWQQSDSRYGYRGSCTKTISGTGAGAYVTQYNITNELPLSTITVTKQWDDDFNSVNNYYNIRPDSVTLGLYRTTGTYPHSTTAGSDEATGWVAVDGKSAVSFSGNNTGRPATKDYVFSNIQRYSFNNTEYKFEVIEQHVNGYTVTYNPDSTTGVTATDTSTANPVARTLKLKNSLDTRNITVTKSWQDNGYSGGASLHYNTNITLSSTGLNCGSTPTAYSDSEIIASEANNDHGVVFEHLPKYDASGNEIAYTVAEKPTDTAATVSAQKSRTADENADGKLTVTDRRYGYAGSMKEKRLSETVNGASKSYTDQFDITNSLPVINITSESLWDDDNNRDGKRPASVTVTLTKTYDNSGTPVSETAGTQSAQKPDETKTGEALTTELASCWTADFGAQPKYAVNNNPYTYSVSHAAPTDYTNRQSPDLTIPNRSSSPYSASETKEYDSGVKEFKPSDSPTVNLFVTKRENDDSAEDTDGTIKFTVLNQYTPDTNTLSIKKTWNDEAAFRSFVRPGSISVDLSVGYYPQTDHTNAYMAVTKLSEVSAADLTNLGIVPATYGTVTINGTASGTEWNYSYSSPFPLRTNPTGTRKINGTSYDIKYQIDENDTNLIGYTKTKSTDNGFLSASGTNTLELENTLRTTDLTLKKVWDNNGYTGTDFSHFGVTVSLSAIAPVSGGSDITIGASTRLNQNYVIPAGARTDTYNTYTVSDVPLYDKDGHKIQYSITELNSTLQTTPNLLIMHNYEYFEPTGTVDSLFAADHLSDAVLTVGNRLPLATVTVTKTWNDQSDIFGLREDITLSLYRTIANSSTVGNKKGDANFHIADDSLSEDEDDGWVLVSTNTFSQSTLSTMDCTFDHILRYDDENHEYRFTVIENEAALQAYDASYADPVIGTGANDGTTTQAIRNTLKTHDVSVSKSWANETGCLDAQNSTETDNLRYGVDVTLSSTVGCSADNRHDSSGKYKETQTIAKNSGPVTFNDLPVCDNTGANFTYTPAETVTGSALTNQYGYTPAFAPASLTDISSASSIALTNTLQKTAVTVTKSWSDTNDKFHLRPTSITLKLYRTTSESLAQSGTLSTGADRNMDDEGSKWVYVDEYTITGINHSTHSYSHTFSDLLMYNKDNDPYYFMVREEHVNGYVTTYPVSKTTTSDKNLTVDNALDTRDIIVTKTWQDNGYSAGSDLHYNIAVTLTGTKSGSAALRWDDPADSTEKDYSQTKVLAKDDKVASGENAGTKYNLIFKGLPKYDGSGEAITYNITERLATGSDPAAASTDADRTTDVSSKTATSAGSVFTPPSDSAHRKYGYIGGCNKRENTETVNGISRTYVEQYDLINTLPLTAVKVEKHWIDQSNEFNLRPSDWHDFNSNNAASADAVNIQLSKKSGMGSYTALAPTTAFRDKYSSEQTKTGDTWTYTYKKLLRYDESNQEYSFRIEEKFPGTDTHIPAYLAPQYCASVDFNETVPVNNKQVLTDLSGSNLNGNSPGTKSLEITNKLQTRDIVVAVKWDDSNYTSRPYDSDNPGITSSYINLRYNLKLTLQSDDLTVQTRKDSGTKYNEYQIIPKLIESTETDEYGVTFYNLPVYKKDGTTVINYKVIQEVAADDAVSRAATVNYSAPQSSKYDSTASTIASAAKFEASSKRYGYESEAKYDSSLAYLEKLNIRNTLPLNTINVSTHWSVDSKHRYYPDSERTVNYTVTRNDNDSDYEKGYKQSFSKPCSSGDTADGTLTYQLVYDYANSPYTYTVTETPVKGYTTDYPENPSLAPTDNSARSKTAAKNTTMQLKIRNTMITGDVSFTKLDKDFYDTYNKSTYSFTAKTIPGATFRLHLGDGTVVNVTEVSDTIPYYVFDNSGTATITSQSGGEIIIKGLPLNSYYLEELSVPSSYDRGTGTDHHDFDIDVNGASSTTADKITYTDSQNIFNPEKPSTMTITKQGYDENGDIQNYENATYLLLRLIPKNINKDAALSALGDDDYKSAAKASAENYLNNTSDLWRYWDNAGTYKTGADGTVRAENLMFGDYLFLEVQAPKGYKITRGIDIVTINETTVAAKTLTYPSGTPTMYDFGNINHLDDQKPAYVEVEKTDEFGNGLNDAEFELYYRPHLSGDILVATVKTGDDGLNGFEDDGSGGNTMVTIVNSSYAELAADKKTLVLKKWGSYFFKETKPPVGYEITQEYYPFVIDRTKADMPLYVVTATNTRKKGLVRLTKISSEVLGSNPAGTLLSGAGFKLYKYVDGTDANDKLIHITNTGVGQVYAYSDNASDPILLTTAADGTFSVRSLPWGKYYFKEETAPAGYALNTDRIYFTVGRNSPDTIEVGCADKIAAAKLRITKNITELYDEWGNPTFIFKVKQTSDGINKDRVRTISMTLDSSHKTVTSDDIELEPGSYEVTEVSVARYGVSSVGYVKTDRITARTPSGSGQDTTATQATFTVGAGGDVQVRFENGVSYYDKFSHTESAVNKFNGVKDIEVSCIAPIDIGNKLATGTDLAYKELTKSDVLKAYLVRADGTKEALDPGEYENLVIEKVTTGSALDDSRFEISPADSANEEKFRIMAEPVISSGYVYKLKATYQYKGHTFEKQFEMTFKERAGITKKTVIFKADNAGITYFDLDGNTASELKFTYYIMDGDIHAVTYNGAKLNGGHSEAMTYVEKIRRNAGYESTYEWGSPKWTTSSSIDFDDLETGIRSMAEETLTYTINVHQKP